MQNRQDQSDLLASKLAAAGAAVALLLSAVGMLFVNYGIAAGCGIAAILMFIACEKFHVVAKVRFELPFSIAETAVRSHWETFRAICIGGLAIAGIASLV